MKNSNCENKKKKENSPKINKDKISCVNDKIYIYIENLTSNVNESHLREIFNVFGTVKNLMRPKYSKTPQKHHLSALIEYTNEEDIHHAMKYMNGGQIDGNITRTYIHTLNDEDLTKYISGTMKMDLIIKTRREEHERNSRDKKDKQDKPDKQDKQDTQIKQEKQEKQDKKDQLDKLEKQDKLDKVDKQDKRPQNVFQKKDKINTSVIKIVSQKRGIRSRSRSRSYSRRHNKRREKNRDESSSSSASAYSSSSSSSSESSSDSSSSY